MPPAVASKDAKDCAADAARVGAGCEVDELTNELITAKPARGGARRQRDCRAAREADAREAAGHHGLRGAGDRLF